MGLGILLAYTPNFTAIVQILFMLLPVIFILMLFKMVKKLRFAWLFVGISLALFCSGILIPMASAISATPGSTTTMLGFPVTQTFSGCVDSSYTMEENDVATGVTFIPDSQDQITVTLSPPLTGQNKYELLNSTSNVVLTLYVDNQDILIYLVPILSFMIMIIVFKSISKSIKL